METDIVFVHHHDKVECIVDGDFLGYFLNEQDAIVYVFLNKYLPINVSRHRA